MRAFGSEKLDQWRQEFDRRQARAAIEAIPVARWAPGWRLLDSGADMDPGVRPLLGRPAVLVTHPVSETVPAALERTLTLPQTNPRLALTVASYPDDPAADWEVRVLVDGKLLDRRVVHSPGAWTDLSFDLAPYAGKQVTLRLENAAGGANPWSWEAGYWARAEVVGGPGQ
jgi:hypothetical protein